MTDTMQVADMETEYRGIVADIAQTAYDNRQASDPDKKYIHAMWRHRIQTVTDSLHQKAILLDLLMHNLQMWLVDAAQNTCDHSHFEQAPRHFERNRTFFLPEDSQRLFLTTGQVYVCTVCALSHVCNEHCIFNGTCPWSGICRGHNLVGSVEAINEEGNFYMKPIDYQPYYGDGHDERLRRLLCRILNESLPKFPKHVTQDSVESMRHKVSKIVFDLLCNDVQPVYGKTAPTKRNRLRAAPICKIHTYIRTCNERGFRPLLLKCIEEHLREPLHMLQHSFRMDVVNWIMALSLKIARTGCIDRFDITKTALGLLYIMSESTALEHHGVILVHPDPRIAEHIVPCNRLDKKLFHRDYDKKQVIAAQNYVKNSLRRLLSGHFNYHVDDFLVPRLPAP